MLEKKINDILETGINYFKNGDYDSAKKNFKIIISEYPDSDLADNAHYNLGMIYEKEERFNKAYIEYRIVMEKYPDSDAALFAGDKAEEMQNKIDPAAKDFYDAQSLYIEKKFDKALEKLNAIIVNHKDSILIDNAYFTKGMIYKFLGAYDECKKNFQIVLDEYPESDAAEIIPEVMP